ncbi:MAG: TOBE-like domain-containing protein [Spirochaetia bacterium]|nr:TOBE-like domain-containing protein [Spirochaetia bacterium]
MKIEVKNVSKKFGQFDALRNVSIVVPGGELVSLLGPSGCGKTTLLRIVAGLEVLDSGHILFDDEDASLRTVRDRQVGFVFQHYALFRHMTVFENIAFGLKVRPKKRRPDSHVIARKVQELLQLVQLEPLAGRYPDQLSGGQRQRVALARALAVEPSVLLLDEPFGALDASVRRELRRWLRRLHDEIKITSLFVTHDQDEALEVSDRVIVMNKGRVEQEGTPAEVYTRPASPFVFDFLGNVNLFRGRVEKGKIRVGSADLDAPGDTGSQENRDALVYVRPHELDLHADATVNTMFDGVIHYANSAGPTVRVEVKRDDGQLLEVELSRDHFAKMGFVRGDRVFVSARESSVFVDDYSI